MNQETRARYETLHDLDKKIIEMIITRAYERDVEIRRCQLLVEKITAGE